MKDQTAAMIPDSALQEAIKFDDLPCFCLLNASSFDYDFIHQIKFYGQNQV